MSLDLSIQIKHIIRDLYNLSFTSPELQVQVITELIRIEI